MPTASSTDNDTGRQKEATVEDIRAPGDAEGAEELDESLNTAVGGRDASLEAGGDMEEGNPSSGCAGASSSEILRARSSETEELFHCCQEAGLTPPGNHVAPSSIQTPNCFGQRPMETTPLIQDNPMSNANTSLVDLEAAERRNEEENAKARPTTVSSSSSTAPNSCPKPSESIQKCHPSSQRLQSNISDNEDKEEGLKQLQNAGLSPGDILSESSNSTELPAIQNPNSVSGCLVETKSSVEENIIPDGNTQLNDLDAALRKVEEERAQALPPSYSRRHNSRLGRLESRRQSQQRARRPTLNSQRLQSNMSDSDDDDTLLMIAKKRAVMGEEENNDANDNDSSNISTQEDNATQTEEKEKQAAGLRRGRQINDAHELQRPGAYSKSPGDVFKRCRTFQKESFHVSAASIPDDSDSPRSRQPARKSPTRVPRRERRNNHNPQLLDDEEDDSDLDTKPAAKPKQTTTTTELTFFGPKNSLDNNSKHENKPFPSHHSSMSILPTHSSRKLSLASFRRLPTSSEASLRRNTTGNSRPSTREASLRRLTTGGSRPSTRSSNASNRSSLGLRLSPNGRRPTRGSSGRFSLNNRGRSIRGSRESLTLASLARSMRLDSDDDSLLSDESSDLRIAELAQQSVSNFVSSFRESMDSTTLLPIAATVVPSEEDLEELIRSRLEAELQSHLTQELSHFRQNVFQEIVRRGQVQIAEVLQDLEEEDNMESSGSGRRDLFQDESVEEDDSSNSHDQLSPLDPAISERRAQFRNASDIFRNSIRQSIRMEFGNLEDELDDVEQARVITASGRTCDNTATLSSSGQGDDPCPQQRKIKQNGRKDKRFVFSSRGLLGSVFVVFLIGALVGAGASILAMQSIRGA